MVDRPRYRTIERLFCKWGDWRHWRPAVMMVCVSAVSAVAAPSGMLAGAFVMDLARDAAGVVWAGTEDGGVLRGDPDAGTWEAFKVQGVDGENHA